MQQGMGGGLGRAACLHDRDAARAFATGKSRGGWPPTRAAAVPAKVEVAPGPEEETRG